MPVLSHDPLLDPDITRGAEGTQLDAKGPVAVGRAAASRRQGIERS